MKKSLFKFRFIFLSIIITPLVAFADPMSDARQNALDFGGAYKNNGSSIVTSQNKINTPGYTTDSPDQTKYYGGTSTNQDTQTALNSTQQGDLMKNGLANRKQMTIKSSDAFLSTSQAITGNPDAVAAMLTGTYGECKPLTSTQTTTEVRSCDQYVEPNCVNGADLVKVTVGEYTTYNYPILAVNPPYSYGSGGCRQYSYHSTVNVKDPSLVNSFVLSQLGWDDSIRITINGTIVYANGSFGGRGCERSTAFWTSPNLNLKPYLVAGDNSVDVLVGIGGSGFVSATFSIDYPVNKVCNTVDTCVNIPSNCSLQSSNCINFSDKNICNYTQKIYACATTTSTSTAQVQCGSDIYCTNGQCTTVEDNSSNDFAKSISYLQAINQTAKDNNGSTNNLKIFSGSANSCSNQITSYNNCCSDSGWGQTYLGASCSSSEIQLAELQTKKLCHYVGSYCSKKIPLIGTCQTTTKSYCCFTSKISRVIVEQGRAQLGLGWGSGQSPDCGGLSPTQLESLQFDKMDLSEISADIAGSVVMPNTSALQGRIKTTLEGYGKTSN
jgi:hypothetical protein